MKTFLAIMAMKRLVSLIAAVLVLGGLAGGLSAYAFSGPDSADTSSPDTIGPDSADVGPPDVISILKLGDTYEVSLDSNPSTGYRWLVEFDEDYLELVDRRFELDSDLNPPPPGTGGKETFVFRTVAKGNTQVEFTYKRPWESESLDSKLYALDIS